MSTAAKKPPVGGRDPTNSPSNSPTSRTHRTSIPSSAATPGSPARTRSVRGGTPVAARAAAHQRTQSRLNMATSSSPSLNSNGGGSGLSGDAEENARAETVALLDDLKERLSKAEGASEHYKRQAEVLQNRLDEALQEQAKMEEKVHEHEEQIEALRSSDREAARRIREMEAIYEAERSSMTKEKEEMANREEEMQTIIQRLKDSLAQRPLNGADEDPRPSRQSNNNSPAVEGSGFAPPSSLQRSDSRNNSKLLLQKDKLIESLRLELAEAQIKLVESENKGGGRMQEIERLLMEARTANARLMEDNESYQLLLQEKTLKGDFGQSDFSYMGAGSGGGGGGGGGGAASNQDALNALEGRAGGTSLADELSEATESEAGENYRRLETELKSMKDQNKALTLYINRIIERLLQHQDFESILDQSTDFKSSNTNKELPPPPQQQAPAPSLLQRAKSIAIGNTNTSGASPRPRPRPMSVIQSSGSNAHNNPETAPSIPIGLSRNTSVRRSRPMSEQYAGPASVVNQMYKGPDGPISPSLRQQAFFFPPGGPAGNRASSSASVPSGSMSTSGNFPGETSSVSGDSNPGDVSTPPSLSPPRPGGSSIHEKNTTLAGNKPRPLRLVQERDEAEAQMHQANKRASWMNWAWGKKEDGAPAGPAGEPIQE